GPAPFGDSDGLVLDFKSGSEKYCHKRGITFADSSEGRARCPRGRRCFRCEDSMGNSLSVTITAPGAIEGGGMSKAAHATHAEVQSSVTMGSCSPTASLSLRSLAIALAVVGLVMAPGAT